MVNFEITAELVVSILKPALHLLGNADLTVCLAG